jgi:hypothetical protein
MVAQNVFAAQGFSACLPFSSLVTTNRGLFDVVGTLTDNKEATVEKTRRSAQCSTKSTLFDARHRTV